MLRLFRAQGDYRIDSHGAARGDVTRKERYGDERERYSGKSRRIGGGDAEQNGFH